MQVGFSRHIFRVRVSNRYLFKIRTLILVLGFVLARL